MKSECIGSPVFCPFTAVEKHHKGFYTGNSHDSAEINWHSTYDEFFPERVTNLDFLSARSPAISRYWRIFLRKKNKLEDFIPRRGVSSN